ncbi:hypothetical protein [Dyadobacter tibetensis]|uniref:hypothetical protein n=1 Tax=Dyadobacter tibetensis TaxID=1211851 RepID=UPI0004713BAB|nr:hypothetical protein [Dyadobacter tibetensis]
MKISYKYLFLLGLTLSLLSSCKEEDPWVDAAAAPVLVDIIGAPFGYPQAKDPTVEYPIATAKLSLQARLLELDKTNILNKDIGIDSIPVAGVKVIVSLRDGATLAEATSGADGLLKIEKSWTELGVSAPKANQLIKLSWTGSYKGVTFTRFSQIKAL